MRSLRAPGRPGGSGRGMHVDGSWHSLGAAACAARLAGLDAAGVARAVRLASCQIPFAMYAPIAAGMDGRNSYPAHAVLMGQMAAAAAAAGMDAPEHGFAEAATPRPRSPGCADHGAARHLADRGGLPEALCGRAPRALRRRRRAATARARARNPGSASPSPPMRRRCATPATARRSPPSRRSSACPGRSRRRWRRAISGRPPTRRRRWPIPGCARWRRRWNWWRTRPSPPRGAAARPSRSAKRARGVDSVVGDPGRPMTEAGGRHEIPALRRGAPGSGRDRHCHRRAAARCTRHGHPACLTKPRSPSPAPARSASCWRSP
jgi:hypothetical protein